MRSLTRRFHIGDLLAAVTRDPLASQRGWSGTGALYCHMAGRPAAEPPEARGEFLAVALDYADDFAAAVLATYPELGAYATAVVPLGELHGVWLRRREWEFGRYLPAPQLPAAHPLRLGAPDESAGGTGAGGDDDTARAVGAPAADVDFTTADGWPDAVTGAAADVRRTVRTGGQAGPVPARAPASKAAAARQLGRVPRRGRQFHIGDLLALVMGCPNVSYRGAAGVCALLHHMIDYQGAPGAFYSDVIDDRVDDFRVAVLAAHPALGAYPSAEQPSAELLDVWRRRREREFGRYLVAPTLPASHPRRAAHRPGGRDATRA